MKTAPPLFPLPKDGGSLPAPSVKTDGASVPSCVASPQPDGQDACLGAANATSPTTVDSSAGTKKSSKARKGPRRPRFEVTLTPELLDRAVRMAESCSVSLPELVRNWLEGFEEKMLRRAEAHAKAESSVTHPPAAE